MTGLHQSFTNSVVPKIDANVGVDLGFKPKVCFAVGAGLTSSSPTWITSGNPAYAGFGWSPDPATGEQTSVGSGGSTPGIFGNDAGCTISESIYTAEYEVTNLQSKVIDMVSFDCDTAPGHAGSGFTWRTNDAVYGAQRIGLIALGGAHINVKTGSFQWPGSSGNYAVTGTGFTPQLVMFLWCKQDSYNKGYPNGPGSGFGFGAASSASDQFCHYSSSGYLHLGGHAPISCHMTGKVIQAADTALLNSASLVSLDADGFTVNFTGDGSEADSNTARLIGWIALRDTGGGFHVGSGTAKTSTGPRSYTGCGFTPDQVITHHGNVPTANIGDATRGSFGMGMFDETTQISIINGERLNGANSSGRYQTIDSCVSFSNTSPVVTAEAEVASMDADGFTLNWTTANGTAYPFGWIAMKTTGGNGSCGGVADIYSFADTVFPL